MPLLFFDMYWYFNILVFLNSVDFHSLMLLKFFAGYYPNWKGGSRKEGIPEYTYQLPPPSLLLVQSRFLSILQKVLFKTFQLLDMM